MSKQRPDGDFIRDSDRFSNLHVELIHKILKFVPIRDVVRTSALSRFWRSIWMFIPDLVFDAHSIPTKLDGMTQTNRVDFVNHVLMLHLGEISRFEIRSDYLGALSLDYQPPDVDRWIILVSRKMVQELILQLHGPKNDYLRCYRMPSALFACQQLRLLELRNCVLNLPDQIKGFSSLTILKLHSVKCTDETLASIIANSPLQRLVLESCYSIGHLNINAPDLVYFRCLITSCKTVNFCNTPKLSTAIMGSKYNDDKLHKDKRLEVVLGGLVNTQTLSCLRSFSQIMAGCIVPKRLYSTFYRLRKLVLCINLNNSKELSTALCLFRSSPYLQAMTIMPTSFKNEGETSEVQLHKDEVLFPSLNTAALSWFKGTENEMRFAQFILMNAMVLHTLTINWEPYVDDPDEQRKAHIMKDMNRFQRASPRAEVIFSGKE